MFKVGDKVKVVRKVEKSNDKTYHCYWNYEGNMDWTLQQEGTVFYVPESKDYGYGLEFSDKSCWYYLEECLELVEDKRDETTNNIKESNPKDSVGVRKAPLSVVPMNVIAEVGVAMLEGACKYGRHNYRGVGVRASVYFDALMRHAIDWWEGEDIDPDSNLSHITKAITTLTVLRDAMMQDKWEDDRPPRSAKFYPDLNKRAGEIIDKYTDKNPKHYTIKDSNADSKDN